MTLVERLHAAEASLCRCLEQEHHRLVVDDLGIKPPGRKSRIRFILQELDEIRALVRMLARSVERSRIASQTLWDLHPGKTYNVIPGESDLGQRILAAMSVSDAEGLELTVLFKTLYEWIYHLQILLNEPEIRKRVGSVLWNRLDAYAEFRNGLITHKQNRTGCVITPLHQSADFQQCRLVFNTWGVDSAEMKELDSLFQQCVDPLSPDEAQETNFYERCRILNSQQHKLVGDMRRRAVAFIKKHGAQSADLGEVVDFVVELAEELLPKLPES